jgi:hypothetical protein
MAILGMLVAELKGATEEPVVFMPKLGIRATVVVKGAEAEYEVTDRYVKNVGATAMQTEKKVNVTIADYNFDGYKDFSLSHIDDGMGTYTKFRIFVYSPKASNFVELVPECGGEFINVVRSDKKRRLTNSYFVDHQMKSCNKKY